MNYIFELCYPANNVCETLFSGVLNAALPCDK